MIELIKKLQQLSRWMASNTTQSLIFILIAMNVGSIYGWKRTSDMEHNLFGDYMQCQDELRESRQQAMQDIQDFATRNLREKDSLINVLNIKIQDMNKIINSNKITINTIKK